MAAAIATVIAFLATVSLASGHNGPLVTAAPNGAPAGTRVAVTVNAVEGTVQIRWANAAGQVLATGTGGRFTATVTIPAAAAPNVYYLRAVVDGEVKASGAFEVTASPAQPTAAVQSPPATESPQATAGLPVTPAPRAQVRVRVPTRPAVKPRGAAAGRSPAHGTTRPAPAGAVKEESGRVVFADSLARGRRSSPARKASRGRAAKPQVTAVSKQSPKRARGLPSLTSSADSTPLDDGPGSRLGIGIALLALGLLAPLAGFLVAEARRRRPQAGPARRR